MKVGILALQGDFAEHENALHQCGCQTILIKHGYQLDEVDGLIIPGGESTTIARLTADHATDLFTAIQRRAEFGMPIYGTCMGTIFLAREIEGSTQGRLALMDIKVRRNAFGPQKYSREETVSIPALGSKPFPVVFIRGPIILECGSNVEVLGKVEEGIVMARQGNLLVTAFHPELTDDLRVHELFKQMIANSKTATTNKLEQTGRATQIGQQSPLPVAI